MNSFAVWVGLGSAMGLWRVARSAPQRQASSWVNTGLFVLLFSLVGARLFYVWLNWGYFAGHLLEALMIWQGGLDWPGSVIGGWLALGYLALQARGPGIHRVSRVTTGDISSGEEPRRGPRGSRRRITLGWIGDRLYPILPPLTVMIWLGSWQSGIAYGPLTPAGAWWSVPSLDETGVYNSHWPLQPLAALALLVYFAVLEARVKPLRPAGRLSGLAMFGLLVNLLAASLLRADPAPTWQGLRIETLFAAALLLIFLFYLLINSLALRIWQRSSSTMIP